MRFPANCGLRGSVTRLRGVVQKVEYRKGSFAACRKPALFLGDETTKFGGGLLGHVIRRSFQRGNIGEVDVQDHDPKDK